MINWLKKALVAISIIGLVAVLGCVVMAKRTEAEVARLVELSKSEFPGRFDVQTVTSSAVDYAQSMMGKPYDPLMGTHGDPFGKIGFVVCIDVPVRSYQAAGVSLPKLLKVSAKSHPDWFAIGPDNPPSSPFFYRRVRNYHPLFLNHPLLEADNAPRVGDWAFYGKHHIGLIASVDAAGNYEVIEASPIRGRVVRSKGEYMAHKWGRPAFFGRLKEARAAR